MRSRRLSVARAVLAVYDLRVFAVTALGHQGWLIGTRATRVLIDPVLSPRFSRMATSGASIYPPRSLDLAAFPPIDAVLVSHEHPDHLDRPGGCHPSLLLRSHLASGRSVRPLRRRRRARSRPTDSGSTEYSRREVRPTPVIKTRRGPGPMKRGQPTERHGGKAGHDEEDSMDLDDYDDDIEDALEGARRARPKEHLVEVMRTHGGRPRSLYFWSGSDRIFATVSGGIADIERRYGEGGGQRGIRLDLAKLRAAHEACRRWQKMRHEWAAFYTSAKGLPGGFGCHYIYQPPGAKKDLVILGTSMMGRLRGKTLVGDDVVVVLPKPARVSRGAVAIAEIWRRGERHGPKAGSLVGVRYDIGGGLVFDARRESARIADAKGQEVFLEEDETPFIRALVGVLARRATARVK